MKNSWDFLQQCDPSKANDDCIHFPDTGVGAKS